MPIGAAKLGVLGAGLVPGGTETFNASGTFSIPPGVKKVSITGVGGTGSPGNSGAAGNSGNPGFGGGGGGGGQVRHPSPRPGCVVTSWNGSSGGAGGAGSGGAGGGVSPSPPTGAAASLPGANGPAGTGGSAGSAGNPGNTGASSSALGQTFCGGAGGNGGTAGNAGNAGTGGTGGTGGGNIPQLCGPSPRNGGPGAGGNGGSPGPFVACNFPNFIPTVQKGPQFCFGCVLRPLCSPRKFSAIFQGFGAPGGGGAGDTNSGSPVTYNLDNNIGDPFIAKSNDNMQLFTALNPYPGNFNNNFPGPIPMPNCFQWFNVGMSAKVSVGGTPGGGSGGIGASRFDRNAAGSSRPTEWWGFCAEVGLLPGKQGNNSRAGGGGGSGGNICLSSNNPPSKFTAGGGGGGGRGNAGNAGGSGGAGNPGTAATPSTVNCVPVTPGTNAPIVVGSPGGQVVISWNPQ